MSIVADGEELSVYDAVTGKGGRWLLDARVSEPRWNPAGDRVAVLVRDRVLVGDPDANLSPETLIGAPFSPSAWPRDELLIGTLGSGSAYGTDLVLLHRTPSGARADTVKALGSQSRAVLSPDGRWMALMSDDDIVVEDFPRRARRLKIGRGLDPLWVSASELLFRDGITFHWLRIDPATGEPHGESRPTWRDERFIDTPMRSQALTPDGRLVYVRGSGRATGQYVRVVQDWMSQLRKAVKAAGQ